MLAQTLIGQVPDLPHSPATNYPFEIRAFPPYIHPMTQAPKTSVLYNAECPVCNFEISHYAKYSADNDLPIRFDDLNTEAREAWNIDADTAARRLYVLHEGELLSGMPAFRVLWAQMPKYKWLVRPTGWPVIKPLTEWAYDKVLSVVIYKWHLRRKARRTAKA